MVSGWGCGWGTMWLCWRCGYCVPFNSSQLLDNHTHKVYRTEWKFFEEVSEIPRGGQPGQHDHRGLCVDCIITAYFTSEQVSLQKASSFKQLHSTPFTFWFLFISSI